MRMRAEKYRDKADEADAMADCFVSLEARRDLRVIASIYRRMAADLERRAVDGSGRISYQAD